MSVSEASSNLKTDFSDKGTIKDIQMNVEENKPIFTVSKEERKPRFEKDDKEDIKDKEKTVKRDRSRSNENKKEQRNLSKSTRDVVGSNLPYIKRVKNMINDAYKEKDYLSSYTQMGRVEKADKGMMLVLHGAGFVDRGSYYSSKNVPNMINDIGESQNKSYIVNERVENAQGKIVPIRVFKFDTIMKHVEKYPWMKIKIKVVDDNVTKKGNKGYMMIIEYEREELKSQNIDEIMIPNPEEWVLVLGKKNVIIGVFSLNAFDYFQNIGII